MREIPECLNRRYLMLDKLIKDLSSNLPPPGSVDESASCDNNQVGIKMMCDFWNILQDDPECNLTQEVQQRLCGEADCSGMYGPARVDCFRASKDQDSNKGKELPVNRVTRIRVEKDPKASNRHGCCANSTDGDKLPLSQVLCNLKEAASYDKKCNVRVGELMTAQAELKEQIQILEEREKQGGELLKQADAMWSCMEESYKKKVAESQDRYAVLTKELKEIEQSANKWRKNKKDLEFQMQNITQCNEDIKEKIKQKKNDLKIMDLEIIDFKNRIESNDKDLYKAKNSYKAKKEASDARIATIASEMAQVEKKLAVEYKHKADKEQEGVQYVKEAREDLQKICRVLLQKKLENEDLQAEKEALIQDIDLLKQTCDNCKEKCANKEKSIEEEIKKVEADLIEFRKKCIKCHECTDTIDVRKFCTDCPRCLAERDCLYEGDHCSLDHSMDCVCMSVKQKFLDNVFDNMYTVLERQSKTCPGKAVADCVLNCLKRSRNGKLNEETRKVLQEFILSTVKKNLNLTIVGGAVKTRCEMDPETYKQLMVCLKEVAVTKPVKEDKGTGSRKEPCRRWGGPSECHCPKGPKACICTKKALPPPTDPVSCGPQPADEKESPSKICPVREPLACSLDCGMLGLPGASDLKREPCAGQSCAFSKNSKNMRAAQCMLGTEALASIHHHPTPPLVPNLLATDKKAACTCGGKAVKPCPCHRDEPRQQLIEEVLGRYSEVSPIEKVPSVPEQQSGVLTSSRRPDFDCDCSNLPMKYLLSSNTSQNKICRYCACSSNYVSRESRNPFVKKIRKKGNIINICRNSRSDNDTSLVEDVQLGLDVGFKISQRNKTIINKPNDDIKIILCPKFQHASCDDKIEKTLGTSDVKATIIESTHLKLKHKSSAKVLQKCKSFEASFVGRKVGETVKQLMKDIVIPHMPPTNNLSSSEVEWVTLKSLYKEISSLTKLEDLSTDTVNEVEVKCETLEASKEFRLLNKNTPEVKSISILSNIVKSQQSMSDKEASDKKSFDAVISETIHKPQKCGNVGAEELKIKLLEDIRQTYNISVETSLENVKDRELNGRKINNTRKCLVKLEEKELEPYECNCIKTQNRNPANRKSTFRKIKKAAPVDPDNYSQISDTKKDAKHLKAEVKDECNKGTCANFRKPSTNRPEDVYEQVGISRQRQGRSPQANAKKRAGQNVAKDQFKIAINNENGKAKNQFTKLTKTKSGRVAMELDEDIIELLEQKSKYDSYLYISVRKTDSGNLLLYFDTKGNDVDNTQRVTVRQTPSGTRLLDIHKTMMNMLRETLSNRVPNSSVSKSIKLSVSSTREDSPTKVPKLSDEYLKKIGNETQSLKNNIMPSQDMKDKIEGKEDIRCPCPAGSPVSVCSKVKSDTNSPIKDGSNPLTIVDKENLKCKNTGKCPKAMPDSVCCKLKDDTNCPSDLVEPKDISGPSPSIKDKYFPIKPNKKADNSCTCPKGSPDRSCCKQTNLPQKGIRRATDTVLPQSHKEDKNMCSCPKSIPLPVCSKQSKVIPGTEKHIKSKLITKAEEVTSNRISDISGSEVREDESDFISELTYLYKEGNANIFVKVRGKNGIMRILSTVVTKTESGTIAFYGGDISSLKNTEYDGTDHPVLLSKTASGTLFINLESTDEKVNAMLRKTPSGGILLIPKTCKECKRHSSEELFKVVVTGVTTSPVELPAVLKMTLSENYIILLDKEFEKHCKEVFDELVGLKTECFVDLHRTDSGDYIIELDTEGNAPTDKNNALLIKSSSGNLKVLVHGPVFEALLPDLSSKSSASSAKAFGQIINKLPASSREIHRENLRKSKRLDRKASSDTQIYEKIKVQLQENKQLLSEPSAILKRTDSGQYSIVLNKESKKAFINNLQHYLTTNSEGLIPIRRSNSGQIIISLNNNNEGKGNFGSLKITSSGNIYILVDEDIIKDMSKDSKDVLDKTGSKRPRNIADLIATVSKAVATTCHAKPDDCDCDTTKCICDELQLETIDWSQENPAKFVSPILKKNIVESVDRRHPIPRDEPPHIVIKPNCDCGALPNSKFGSTEQCFIVVDSVCPFHKDRYKAVSNELLEISGLCKTHEKNNENEILELEANHDIPSKGEQREVWDSLNYLPPQLPSFLKDVCYR